MQVLNELKGFLFEGAAEPPGIIIYSQKITPRLKYVCKFVFNQGLLCNYLLTDNESEFISSKLGRINYSDKTFENAINISPNGLLDNGAVRQPIMDTGKNTLDIFSYIFYFIGRVEEWRSENYDEHGRFFDYEFVDEPYVDMQIGELKKELIQKFKLQFKERKFKFISTIDVDNVYAYRAKPFYRQIGGMLKDLKNSFPRLGTILFGKKDPFDEYEMQVELSKKYNVPLIYFFLYRNNTRYDRTIDPNHPEFKKLFRFLNDKGITYGLHPSYDSSRDPSLLKSELELLAKNSGKQIICSRQHYLRFSIRSTPKELFEAGIRYDFTMGMADEPGFKAGTSLPFYYYDLATESELNLLAVPFVMMDGAYYVYEKMDTFTAYNSILGLAEKVKAVNGLFITVVHERSFSDKIAFGWKDLYIKLHETLGNRPLI
jgi:hypothetical protein